MMFGMQNKTITRLIFVKHYTAKKILTEKDYKNICPNEYNGIQLS